MSATKARNKFFGVVLVFLLAIAHPVYASTLSDLEARYDQLRQSLESDTYLLNVTLRGYEAESGQCYLRYVSATDPLEIQQRNNCKAAYDSTQQSIFDVTRRAGSTLTEMQSLRVQIDALKAAAPTSTPTPTPTPTTTPTPTPTPLQSPNAIVETAASSTPVKTGQTQSLKQDSTEKPLEVEKSSTLGVRSSNSNQRSETSRSFSLITSSTSSNASLLQFDTNAIKKSFRVVATKKGAKTIRLTLTSNSKGVITVRSKMDLSGYSIEFSQGNVVVNRHLVAR